MITEHAYAKLNLSLEVLGQRADGYHDLVSVMQLIELHDTLVFNRADELEVECDDADLAAVKEANLVWRAARLLQDSAGVRAGARIVLWKRIPMSAGMGGGSSDAAATLRGLARLWGLKLRADEMHYLAALLGSDVPFLLGGPAALVEGRGEIITALSSIPPAWVVLVCPSYNLPNKTRQLYANLEPGDMANGDRARRLVAAISKGKFPTPDMLHNAFERAAHKVFEGLEEVQKRMSEVGGRAAHLSGSGPTLYTLFPEAQESQARKLCNTLQAEGLPAAITRTVT
ncbi:MAG TPA: 4-(cytidine 5'-diphospho)-2-C-methyl-D-erythritol kinase [Chloroflexia bacterium]|nr:4-(cytidine 5'-diphospho)-2-C-methyl-D-erythritol kinase [Chloroflexia bacterium]